MQQMGHMEMNRSCYTINRKLSFFLNFKKAREKELIHSIILLKKLLMLQIFIVNKHPQLNDF